MFRFNFGVPLEDIFPPNDIHPRLKYLFEEAYRLYISNRLSLEKIVRQLQGPLETRLHLKQKIINDAYYDIKTKRIEEAPGTYFWLIRHFLGLLPIPLLPTYSQNIRFKWISLSKKCRTLLRNYESDHAKKYELDYEFAEELNLLPFQHFLLLTILVNFIRNLSRKTENGRQINRRSLIFLSKYYYASTCIRPYIPGHKEEKMFPMFFYVVLRWREIEKRCRIIGHPAYFLESSCMNYETYQGFSIRDNWAQTRPFSPKVVTIYKNVPYFCDNNNYLKDISCQTEQTDTTDKATLNSEIKSEAGTSGTLKHEKISDIETCSVYPALPHTSSPIKEDEFFVRGEKLHENTGLNFLSIDDGTNNTEWRDIVKETAVTVKKVEEYIYDDYDTFSKEEYNQISDSNDKSKSNKLSNADSGSFMNKVSKIGWTYTPENSAREGMKDGSPDENEANDTYVKFEDVFDENGKYKTNGDYDNDEIKENSLNVTFRKKCNDSRTPLFYSVKSAEGRDEIEEGKSRKNFNLKRFKLKLDFLRVLTPKRTTCPTPSCDTMDSKVKYKKIKNIKSNTL